MAQRLGLRPVIRLGGGQELFARLIDAASSTALRSGALLFWNFRGWPLMQGPQCDVSMILTGNQIQAELGRNIVIEPFTPEQLNPNSYNMRLHDELLVYEEVILDMRKPNRYRRVSIPPEGLVLNPQQLYLGRTIERTETHNLVPMLEGRSSIGRLGLFVHITAGFGDIGFKGYWTLEMFAVQPIRIYAGIPICQIFYHDVRGDITEYASSKYQNNQDIQPSLLFKEWQANSDPQKRLAFGQESPQ